MADTLPVPPSATVGASPKVMLCDACATVIVNALIAVTARLSVTCTVKLSGPAVVGVPVIAPVAALRLSPMGVNAPTVTAQFT